MIKIEPGQKYKVPKGKNFDIISILRKMPQKKWKVRMEKDGRECSLREFEIAKWSQYLVQPEEENRLSMVID